MGRMVAIWHGSDEDLRLLRDAVVHNCTCQDDKSACPAHAMLTDQNTVDHLAFVAFNARRYIRAEFNRQDRRRPGN